MAQNGGMTLQTQALKLNGLSFFCAQYLRASSHFVHSICATIQAWTPWSEGRKGLPGGLKAWDSQLTEFQSLSPLCAVRYAHR